MKNIIFKSLLFLQYLHSKILCKKQMNIAFKMSGENAASVTIWR